MLLTDRRILPLAVLGARGRSACGAGYILSMVAADRDRSPQEPATLAEKLDDMTLHDETGDPRDEGYMAAVRELRDWLARRAELRGVGEPADAAVIEK